MRSLVVALLMFVPAIAIADTAQSFAYVTKVNGYRDGSRQHPHDHCSIVAQLPKAIVATQPVATDTALVGSDATTVSEVTDDDNDVCDRLLHTWVGVSFDPATPTTAHFEIPDPGWTISRVIGLIVIALGIAAFAGDRIRRRRQKLESGKPV